MSSKRGPVRAVLAEGADILRFSRRAIGDLRHVGAYTSEVLRQTMILITGSTVVILLLIVAIGGVVGIFGTYVFSSIGAADYLGAFTAVGGVREAIALNFGYIFAAKVGCGLVAEIGSMRISEELDAYESVGIDPMRFVVATRVAASLLYLPFIFPLAVVTLEVAAGLSVIQLGEVSQGQWEAIHFQLHDVPDLIYSFVRVAVAAVIITLVGCYYGYTVSGGGPVEVGDATARSIIVNLVVVQIYGGLHSLIFYGGDIQLPIGG